MVSEDFASNDCEECIWCDVNIGNEITLFGVCYRCPSSNKASDEALCELISKASALLILFILFYLFIII